MIQLFKEYGLNIEISDIPGLFILNGHEITSNQCRDILNTLSFAFANACLSNSNVSKLSIGKAFKHLVTGFKK